MNVELEIDTELLETFLEEINGDIIIDLPISIEKNFYNGKLFSVFIGQIKKLLKQYKSRKFPIIKIDVGDSLNRHICYYRYCVEYMLKNNIKDVDEITTNIKEELKKKSYEAGLIQGNKWFKDNIRSINKLIPKNAKISNKTKLNNEITVLYEGCENNPKVEYVKYDYWLNHKDYKGIKCILDKLKDSVIERAYDQAVNYYMERFYNKEHVIEFEELFRLQSKKYIKDECVAAILLYKECPNTIEIYFGGREGSGTQVFKGKKAQNDPIIKKYLEGPLKCADKRRFIPVKLVQDYNDTGS
jgi:hypothetical protein